MGVDGTASAQEIIRAVEQAGYGASEKGAGNQAQASMQEAEKQLEDHETPKLKRRLFWSLGFLLVLMYISMGHMMWGWRLPSFFDGNHVAMGLAQLLLTVIVMVINQRFFISGFKALWNRAPNMDTLVALERRIFVQHLRAVCHDRRAGPGRYGRSHGLHDGLLF